MIILLHVRVTECIHTPLYMYLSVIKVKRILLILVNLATGRKLLHEAKFPRDDIILL